jgi:Ser/Thr protein kinase RdoA (MazF antagonist)
MVNCTDGAEWPSRNPPFQIAQSMSSERSTGSTPNSVPWQVLAAYPAPYQPQRIIALQSGGGYSGARLWRVVAASGEFCLRAMPAERVNVKRLHGLHRLLAHVRAGGVPQSPMPVPRLDGNTCAEHGESIWQLEPWMLGSADYCNQPTPQKLHNALVLLARWHQAAASFVAQSAEASWFFSSPAGPSPGIGERYRLTQEWNAARCALVCERLKRNQWPAFDALGLHLLELYREALPELARALEQGRHIAVPLQPCLRDIWHDHVLFMKDEATGLIDAHAARTESVATDLARLLGSLVGDDRAGWESGLAAYAEARPLTPAVRRLVGLFDSSAVVLSGLTWLQWKCLDGRTFDRPEAVINRMTMIVGRLETLVRNRGVNPGSRHLLE